MWRCLPAGILLAACAFAQQFEHYRLPNGMQVIFYLDRRAPVVHVNLHFAVGSKDERPGKTGFAHLFEHMMIEGADAGSDFFTATSQLGATDANAATGPDATEYYETVPSSRLERILWLESNRFANLLKILNQERLDNQRGVVRNELRANVENKPYGRFGPIAYENVFPAGHPYSHEVIGSHEDLTAASLEDVRAFYREHYTPDNLSLMLAGDFDTAQARQWIARYFGGWVPGGVRNAAARWVPQLNTPKLVEVHGSVPDEKVFFVWPGPGMFDPEGTALEVAQFVLGQGPEHFGHMTENASGEVSWDGLMDASLFIMAATLPAGTTMSQVDNALETDLKRFAQEGPTEEEMTRARNNLEFQFAKKSEDLHEFASTVQGVQQYYGTVDRYKEWAGRFRRVTAVDVRSAVAKWLATPNRLAIHFIPENLHRDEIAEPDRKTPPPFGTEKPYRPPQLKSTKLANGLQVLVVERHEIPIVAAGVRFKIGPAYDPAGKNGLAMLATAAALGGTSHRSKEQLEREKSRLAISLRATADWTSQLFGFEVLPDNLDPAIELLADVVRNANFPSDAFDDAKKEMMREFIRTEGRIDDFMPPAATITFGKDHPLGGPFAGTQTSLTAITPSDASEFIRKYWKPDVTALTFVGDITLESAVAIAKKHFGDWSGTVSPPAVTPEARPLSGRLFLVDRPGATQTMVVQVLPGISRDHADYPPLLLLDRVWGGMFSSRLNLDIREQKGITYGAHSQMLHFPGSGIWFAFSGVQADRTRDAIRVFARELRNLAGEKPVTSGELQLAKDSFLHEYPDHFARAWRAVERISADWAAGLPPDDYLSLPQRVAAITLEQVNAAARKYARSDRAFFLLLGDREKIGDLRDLELGSPTLMK